MKKKALIVWGGWLGHQPEEVAAIYKRSAESKKASTWKCPIR